jgi:hypothetical protein
MSSPGSVRVRKPERIEWMLLHPLDRQETRAYPRAYEEARQPLVAYLLSMTTTPIVDEREQPSATPAPDLTDDLLDVQRDYRGPPTQAGSLLFAVNYFAAAMRGQSDI